MYAIRHLEVLVQTTKSATRRPYTGLKLFFVVGWATLTPKWKSSDDTRNTGRMNAWPLCEIGFSGFFCCPYPWSLTLNNEDGPSYSFSHSVSHPQCTLQLKYTKSNNKHRTGGRLPLQNKSIKRALIELSIRRHLYRNSTRETIIERPSPLIRM